MEKLKTISYILASIGILDMIGQAFTHGELRIIHSILNFFFN